jgi:hypothetical protein
VRYVFASQQSDETTQDSRARTDFDAGGAVLLGCAVVRAKELVRPVDEVNL